MFRLNARRMVTAIVVGLTLALLLTVFEGPAGAATTIKVWIPDTLEMEVAFWKDIIKDFEKENPDIKVAPEFMEGGGQFALKFTTAIKTGEVPDVVHSGGATAMETLIRGGVLQPITEYIDRDKFLPGMLLPYKGTSKPQWKGELFIMPLAFNFSLPAYNKEIFDKFGLKPARTREDHLVLLADLKKKGVIPIMAAGQGTAALVLWTLNELIETLSGDKDLFDRLFYSMVENFDNSYFRQALEIFRQDAEFFGAGWETAKGQDIETLFLQGRLAIQGGTPRLIKQVENEVTGFKLGFTLPPTIQGKPRVVKGTPWGFGISTTTKNKEEAVRFIRYLTTEKAQAKLFQTFLDLPATQAVYESRLMDSLVARYPDLKLFMSYRNYVTIDPVVTVLPQSMQLGQKLADAMIAVGIGKLTVDQASAQLNQIQQKLRDAMKGGK